jgi:hypothetical protein
MNILLLVAALAAQPCARVSDDVPRVYDSSFDGDRASKLVPADLDGDAFPDLIAVGLSESWIFYGKRGGFEPPVSSPFTLPSGRLLDAGVADFDGDGRQDVVGTTSSSVVLWRNLGRSFSAPITLFEQWWQLFAIASVADLTEDGAADILVQPYGRDQSAFLLINDGQGSFTARTIHPTTGFNSVVAADFDGDGHVDLADRGPLRIFRGDGSGNFVMTAFALPDDVRSADDRPFAVDIDADGHEDLIVVVPEQGEILLFRGPLDLPRPAPAPVRLFTLLKTPVGISSGDYNGDGHPDLVVFDGGDAHSYPLSANRAVIYLGDGEGNFIAPDAAGVPAITPIAAADFDDDGLLDLAVYQSPTNIVVYRGRGDGMLSMPRLSLPSMENVIATADLDGDGVDELIALRGQRLVVGRLQDSGAYAFEPTPLTAGDRFSPMISQEIGGTGLRGDFPVAAGDVHPAPGVELLAADGNIVRFFSRAGGAWHEVGSFDAGMRVQALAVTGLIAVAGTTGRDSSCQSFLKIFDPSGAVISSTPLTCTSSMSIAAADVDSDGVRDLIVASHGTWDFCGFPCDHRWLLLHDGSIRFFRGLADGTVDAPVVVIFRSDLYDLSIGDFNADGHPDLAVTRSPPSPSFYGSHQLQLEILYGNGYGTFAASAPPLPLGRIPAHAAADFNRDGADDLVLIDDFSATFLYGSPSGVMTSSPSFAARDVPFVARRGSGAPAVLYNMFDLPAAGIIEHDCRR